MERKGILDALKKDLGEVTFLDKSKEKELCSRYRCGDVISGKSLIMSQIPLVFKMARYYSKRTRPDLDLDLDLVQSGIIGLLKALTKFNPDKGRFSTYATSWVRGEIIQCINDEKKYTALKKRIYEETSGKHKVEKNHSNSLDGNSVNSDRSKQKQQYVAKSFPGGREGIIPSSPLDVAVGIDIARKFQEINGKDKFLFIMKYNCERLSKQELIELHKKMFPDNSHSWGSIRQFVKSTVDKLYEFILRQ